MRRFNRIRKAECYGTEFIGGHTGSFVQIFAIPIKQLLQVDETDASLLLF